MESMTWSVGKELTVPEACVSGGDGEEAASLLTASAADKEQVTICLSCGTNFSNTTKLPWAQKYSTFSALSALAGLLTFLYILPRSGSLGPSSQRNPTELAQHHSDARLGPNASYKVLPIKLS